jgi:hypothetical protein
MYITTYILSNGETQTIFGFADKNLSLVTTEFDDDAYHLYKMWAFSPKVFPKPHFETEYLNNP